ncbi:putative sensor protein gacS, partial [Amylocarpus encephaloides]
YYQPDNEKSSKNEDGTRAPKASTDPILTAFAQLGALRLNTKRGIITLSTGTSEFMLAESGKALLLQQENDEGDKLWHGVGTFKCQLGKNKTVGAELVDHFCNSEDSCMIVNDMTKHDMFKDKCVVTKAPNVRFLAAVPLRTPGSHIVIGNYIVADDVIREEGLTEAEIAFMMDMGVTVMDYLQAGLIKKKQHRSERMIKAHSSTKKNQKGPELEKLADAEFGVQEPINNLSKQLEHWPEDEALASMPQTPSSTSAMSRNDPVSDGRPIIPRGDSHVTSDSATQSTLLSKSWKDRNSSVTTFDASVEPTTDSKENRTSVSFDLPPAQVTDDATLPKELQDALLSSELKAVFSRASNLIREAIGVQGVIFYDASIGSFGASTDRGISDEKAPGAFQMDQAPISSEDEVQRILSVADVDVNGHSHSDSGLPSEPFGNSAMAEVARISAQVLDKMKSDFISSISHELRSPLHGVLASVEFLQETQMTEVQEEMVNNIHASGKVLLDTINHVLDFSKVNRRSKNKTSSLSKRARSRKKKGPPDRAGAEDEEADTADILTLSEEVIESIYAGHSVGKPALSPSSHRSSFIASKEHAVNVITEFKYHPNWTFEIDPGAWSRILMNLFSNALKYTKTGFVKISMHVESEGVARSKKSRNNLVLKVRDSGKGISEEFLKHRLFKPFTQEDSLATGTGLGLSIVRHIVQDLEGTIVYTSEQGTGTEVTVRLPLAEERPVKAKDADVVAEVRKVTKGFKYRLEGFDRYPDIAEAPTGILSAEAEAAMLLKSSSSAKLTEWFGMEQSTNPKESGIDVIVIMEAGVPEGGVKDILDSYDHSHPSKSGKSIAVYLHAAFCEPHPQIPAPENHPVEKKQSTEMFRPVDLHPKEKELSPNSTEARDFEHDPTITLSPTEPEKKETEKRSKPTSSPTSNTPEQNGSTIFQPQSPTETTEPTTLRVLLVEDNEINLKLLVATMRKLKIKHFTATNGLEALNVYKEHHGDFDVIFMDISMPIMSGIESARHIRRYEKEEGLRATKLIALTGAANPRTRQEAFSVGVDLYLTKPVPMRELRGMLEEFKGE